jgi:putative phosphoesterase
LLAGLSPKEGAMRLLILSDLHGNRAAVAAIHERYDAMVCLGDLVTYGPDPGFCIDFIRERALWRVQGNHDHAAAFGVAPRCVPAYAPLAEATLAYTERVLDASQRRFLGEAPLSAEFEFGGAQFYAVHAAPSDPLYRYLGPELPDEVFADELCLSSCDVLLLGHTHRPLCRRYWETFVFNPGSVGQPSDGDPRASYGIWEDGHLELKRAEYPIEDTVRRLGSLDLPDAVLQPLVGILRTGTSLGR